MQKKIQNQRILLIVLFIVFILLGGITYSSIRADDSDTAGGTTFLPFVRHDADAGLAPADATVLPPDDGQRPLLENIEWYFENWQLTEEDWGDWAQLLLGEEPEAAPQAEGRAVAPPSLNLAVGQTAMQSSVGWGGLPGRAVDNWTSGTYSDRTTMHTQREGQPWWQVDLKNSYELSSVRLYGRTDCCQDRLSDFYILVSNEDMRGRSLNQLLNDPNVWSLHETGTVNGNKIFSTPTVGRFVRIQRRGTGYLQMAEVQVFGENLAVGKTATQSTTYNGTTVAGKAVDGDIDGVFTNGSVASTGGGSQEWWQLDLGAKHDIGKIWLFNRSDCCQERFAHFYVFVSDTDMTGRSLSDLKNDPNVWEYFEVAAVGSRYLVAAGDAQGRYIRIQRNTTGYLSIAEVVVNGVPTAQASTEVLNPAEFGQWDDPIEWPHISVHASMLPTGKLLTWDATPDDFTPVLDPHSSPNNTVRATLWDPATGLHEDAQTANGTDLFCAGHNQLPDGRLFVAGGTQGYNQSIHNTQTFNPLTEEWILGPNLALPRWYPTVTDLADGTMLVTAGRGNNPERYDPATNSLLQYSGITIGGSWPIIRQAPNGDLIYAGGDNSDDIYQIDLSGAGTLTPINTDNPIERFSVHAMYDVGKMLYVGSAQGTKWQTTKLLDLNTQQTTEISTMNYRRFRPNLIVLADGSVMAIGGMVGGGFCNAELSTNAAEIWHPDTGQWTVMASQDRPRHYHATSVLLPDGRVWSGGSGYATTVSNQRANCPYQNSSEIFSPPYLFNADGSPATRPVISSAPETAGYSTSFDLNTPDANDIQKVALVKLSSVTHKLNTGQRYVPLEYQAVNGSTLQVTTPPDTNHATAGYYMLFIVNGQGTPSVSAMLKLGDAQIPGGQWASTSGDLEQVSYGTDGTTWGQNTNKDVYRRPVNNGWRVLPRPSTGLVQVDALDYDNAVGVTDSDQIYRYANGTWTRLPGGLKHVSYGADGSHWGTNSLNNTYRMAQGAAGWQFVSPPGGGIVQIDALDYNHAIGVTASGAIYHYDNGTWTQVPGNLKHVSYGMDGSWWGTNLNDQTYRRMPTDASWERMDLPVSGFVQVDALAYGRAIAVTAAGDIYLFNEGSGTEPADLSATIAPSAPAAIGTGVTFSGSATGGTGLTYRWDFGDGTTTNFGASPTASHTYQTPGRYSVRLTVRDVSGGQTLVATTQAIHAPAQANRPTHSSSIVYENNGTGRVWNVNPDNNTVTVINAVNRTKAAEIGVGSEPRSLAIAPNGNIWVVNKGSSSISVISAESLALVQTINLDRGAAPYGIAFAPNGSAAFVALEASGQLLKLNPTNGAISGSLDLGQHVRHVSVAHNSQTVYVSRFVTPPLPGEASANPNLNGVGAEILAVNGGTMQLSDTLLLLESQEADTEASARGIPNYLGAVALSPDGQSGWVPSKQDNILRGGLRDGQDLNHDRSLRSISSRIDLASGNELRSARVDHDNGGIASAATYGPYGSYLFVALEGSREVAVLDPYGNSELGRFEVGRAPQGLVVSPDGSTLFVHNFMDRSVSVIDLTTLMQTGRATLSDVGTVGTVANESLSSEVLTGKQLFYDAFDTRVAEERYISCASCHNGGGGDGRVWDFTGFGEGLRNTINLNGHAEHGPMHWSGNFDEVHDFEGQIRTFAGGTGLMSNSDFNATSNPLGAPKAGRSADLDALAAYVESLTVAPLSPNRNSDGTLTAAAQAGQQIFMQNGCASCHSGPEYTDSAPGVAHDIGTLKPSSGQRLNGTLAGIDTPTLLGLPHSAPYLHDGSAATIGAAVNAHRGVSLSGSDLTNLVAYLEQLERSGPTLVERSGSANFDGDGDRVTIANRPELEVGPDDFAVTFWINLKEGGYSDWRSIVHKGNVNEDRTFGIWLIPRSRKLHYIISTSATWNTVQNSAADLPLNAWTHVAYVKTGDTLYLYLDGQLDSSRALSGTILSNNGPIYLGSDPWYSEPNMSLDDFRIYRGTMTSGVLQDLVETTRPDVIGQTPLMRLTFDEGSGTTVVDESGNGNGGTLENSSTWQTTGANGVIQLDGLSDRDRVIIPNSPELEVGPGDFSYSYWLKLQEDDTGAWRSVVHKGNVNAERTFAMWMTPRGRRLHYIISTTATWNRAYNSANPIPLNEWTHVTFVKEGSTVSLYLNGVLDSTHTIAGTAISNNGPIYLGSDPWYAGAGMQMDEFRVYDVALTQADVTALSQASPSGPTQTRSLIQVAADEPEPLTWPAELGESPGTGTVDPIIDAGE